MATLALGALGAAAGSTLLPGGLSLLGATIAGSTIGSQVGAIAGSMIDNALFGASGQSRSLDGPRLSDLHVLSSTEGTNIPRVYGRARIGGQVIWATSLEEEAVDASAAGGGKGAFAGQSNAGLQYQYYANFAVALCQGEITSIGRVWADNREISLTDITWRLYTGTEDQLPDALVEARQGAGEAPAYRGLAYIVFERMPLSDFGNRIPQLSFEVIRSVDRLERDIRGVALIPGSGEFVYATTPVAHRVGNITTVAENTHTLRAPTDWAASLDDLQAKLPNAKSISLVVSWFGDDLRAGHCRIRPLVESAGKLTEPVSWSVAGLTRDTASMVSQHDGRPAYGGTPSDQTVIGAIKDLRARGLSVVFSPFLLMDIPASNVLSDPYSDATSQATYPWRGRITVSPAAGRIDTVDKTAAAAAQLSSFIGATQVLDFALDGETVVHNGSDEWSFRRFILHYAHLCKAAGGVDAFVLCSELRGLTTARSAAGTFPFVDALVALAADVRAILGPSTKILYAADWSEYFGHQPADGSGDVYFHLDPLWAAPDIDAIGIDLYWPLADWRDGRDHLDAAAGTDSVYDLDYLKANLFSGEGFDWYYASQADRDAQLRQPITDGAGKPWAFRYKDLRNWWSHQHVDRPNGIESGSPTAWVPQSKPFWLMEIGCPAVDKGANQPNLFIDPKSAESALPHYSNGVRDDLMQRRVLQALTEAFDPAHPGYIANANPMSAVTGARMIDVSRVHVYCWDARPYPAFPEHTEIWGDGPNWQLGHWLNGRAAAAPLAALVSAILDDFDFDDYDASTLTGTVAGYVIDRVVSARDALQPLELATFIDTVESDGRIVLRPRGRSLSSRIVIANEAVETSVLSPLVKLTRAQETDLPASAKISYISATGDYASAVAEARRASSASGRVSTATLPIVVEPTVAQSIADTWLNEAWVARERAGLTLPQSDLSLEPGDVITIDTGSRQRHFRITDVGDSTAREFEVQAIDLDIYHAAPAPNRPSSPSEPIATGAPLVVFLDIPAAEIDAAHTAYVAAAQAPWPGTVAVYRSPDTAGFAIDTLLSRPATIGTTTSAFPPGPRYRFDHANTVVVALDRGSLQSVSELAVYAGANLAAIEVAQDRWELLQYQSATLVAPSTYRLSRLLRRQRDTTDDAVIAPGARFVLLDAAVKPLNIAASDVGLALNWKVGPARQNIASPSYVTTQKTFHGLGLAPRAPVHPSVERSSSGDLTLSWIRQTRVGGDNWDQFEVPLGETAERYEIDILHGPDVVRTITTTSPEANYTIADQIADFGTAQPAVAVRIYQISPTLAAALPALQVSDAMTNPLQPPWLDHSWVDLGLREAPGNANNPRVVAYYRDAGHPEIASDDVAWCAAFVGACLARAGHTPSGSLMARSYLAWGDALAEPQVGAIAIFSRGSDPTLGHVGFVVGTSPDGLVILGGNQSDAVTVEIFPSARLLGMRWPSADAPGQPSVATTFDRAFAHVLEMEGGFTDDPYDPGGPTNLGITLATLAAYKRVPLTADNTARLRAELLDLDRDTAREIYLARYWQPSKSDLLPPALAVMHFDAAVNHGVSGAARMLQEALAVDIDGDIGPITLSTSRQRPLSSTLDSYATIRLARYESLPHFWRFGRGWTRRVQATRALAVTMTNDPAPPLPISKQQEPSMTTETTSADPKWWGNSMTIWGAIVTGLTNVLPILGPLIGVDISAEMIRDLGQNATQAIQAIGGIIGILLTVVGRMRAIQPLARRDFNVKF